VRIPSQKLRDRVYGEGVQLLDACDRNPDRRLVELVADDVVVELSRAENQPLDVVVARSGIVEHRVERPVGELFERRRGLLETEQALRGHHDERAGDGVERLSAEQMEELRRRRAVAHADVVLGPLLEEPLEPRTRVLRAVPLVAVRKEQREARGLVPLRPARDDELVDHDLRAVDEVAVLRLPDHEGVRRGAGVAVLEAERRVLGERRVVDLERGVGARQALDRNRRLARLGVVKHQVTV